MTEQKEAANSDSLENIASETLKKVQEHQDTLSHTCSTLNTLKSIESVQTHNDHAGHDMAITGAGIGLAILGTYLFYKIGDAITKMLPESHKYKGELAVTTVDDYIKNLESHTSYNNIPKRNIQLELGEYIKDVKAFENNDHLNGIVRNLRRIENESKNKVLKNGLVIDLELKENPTAADIELHKTKEKELESTIRTLKKISEKETYSEHRKNIEDSIDNLETFRKEVNEYASEPNPSFRELKRAASEISDEGAGRCIGKIKKSIIGSYRVGKKYLAAAKKIALEEIAKAGRMSPETDAGIKVYEEVRAKANRFGTFYLVNKDKKIEDGETKDLGTWVAEDNQKKTLKFIFEGGIKAMGKEDLDRVRDAFRSLDYLSRQDYLAERYAEQCDSILGEWTGWAVRKFGEYTEKDPGKARRFYDLFNYMAHVSEIDKKAFTDDFNNIAVLAARKGGKTASRYTGVITKKEMDYVALFEAIEKEYSLKPEVTLERDKLNNFIALKALVHKERNRKKKNPVGGARTSKGQKEINKAYRYCLDLVDIGGRFYNKKKLNYLRHIPMEGNSNGHYSAFHPDIKKTGGFSLDQKNRISAMGRYFTPDANKMDYKNEPVEVVAR